MIVTVIVSSLLGALGLFLARVAGRAQRRNRAFNRRAVQTMGRVIDVQSRRVKFGSSSYRTIYIPTVEYVTPQGLLQAKGTGHSDAPVVGSELSLMYDATKPTETSFTGPRGQHGMANALSYGGWALVVVAVGMVVARLVL